MAVQSIDSRSQYIAASQVGLLKKVGNYVKVIGSFPAGTKFAFSGQGTLTDNLNATYMGGVYKAHTDGVYTPNTGYENTDRVGCLVSASLLNVSNPNGTTQTQVILDDGSVYHITSTTMEKPITYTVKDNYTITTYRTPVTSKNSHYETRYFGGATLTIFATHVTSDGITWGATNSQFNEWCVYKDTKDRVASSLIVGNNAVEEYNTQLASQRYEEEQFNSAQMSNYGVTINASDEVMVDLDAVKERMVNNAGKSMTDPGSMESISKMKHVIGMPPKLSAVADPRYWTDASNAYPNDFGRAYIEMFMMNSTIFSIQPCKVKYLPGFKSDQKESFLAAVMSSLGNSSLGDDAALESGDGLSGQLFEAQPDYNNYINTVNLFARTLSILLGIGTKPYMGTGPIYRDMDYSFYKLTKFSEGVNTNIFSTVADAFRAPIDTFVTSAINDDTYVHFYMTSDGTSTSDSMSVSTRSSGLESLFNNSLSGIAQDFQFLFSDSNLVSTVKDGVSGLATSLSNAAAGAFDDSAIQVLDQLINSGAEYLNGGRLVFPQMLDDCSYDRSYTGSLRLISPYGDVESIFLNCFLPLCYLWPYVIPSMISDNMYKYPFLARASASGLFHSDLAAITNLRIQRGGQDGTSWTADGLPFEIDVQFDVTPLYSRLMATNTRHPILFLSNTALHEYLAAMCGISFTGYDAIELKCQAVQTLMTNEIMDTIPSLLRGYYSTGVANAMRKFFTF